MKGTVLRKCIFLVSAVAFVISLTGAPVLSTDLEGAKIVKGSIVGVSADGGTVEIKDESGHIMNLNAGSDVKLDAFAEGENVTIECNEEGTISKMNKAN